MVKKITKIHRTMSEKQMIRTVNILLGISCVCVYHTLLILPYVVDDHKALAEAATVVEVSQEIVDTVPKKAIPTPTPVESRIPEENIYFTEEMYLRNDWQNITIAYRTMRFTYIGQYFITAYCPAECGGSWSTSSGATCHQSSDWCEPNTVAIDRSLHKYGEILLIGNPNDPDNRQVVVTEDTGPGVQGRWCDVFVETMDEVYSWNTRYDNVWRVSYDTYYMSASTHRIRHERLKYLMQPQPDVVVDTI